uniref:Tetratricopeptide (TPR) repeat protein n=2 Tax=Rhodocyclus tenuis TaxID=1066 RepID=A0A840G424_RHOTE|nr:tetratricopeptide (TPR) repeat protein [Rhodocyclus tenuis]
MTQSGPQALFASIMTLVNARQLAAAENLARTAVAEHAEDPQLLNALGMVLMEQGKELDAARACFGRALSLAPESSVLWENLAVASRRLGDFELAARTFLIAAEKRNGAHDLRFEASLCQLSYGDYETAWPFYEERLRAFPERVVRPASPSWDGNYLAGQRLLVLCEQGLGDSVMMVRYLPFLAAQGLSVDIACPPALVRLMRSLPGIGKVTAIGETLPEHDFHVPIMSIPGLFRTRIASIPQNLPYLAPPGDIARPWRELLAEKDCGVRVGLRWAGNPDHAQDLERSCPATMLAPLLELDEVLFVSLQTDDGDRAKVDADLAALPGVIDARPWLGDMADTAALLQDLNLVISVDTATLHLAGATNRPGWAMLASPGDWRWGRGGSLSHWYPSLKLFRQAQRGNWPDLVLRIREELLAAIQGSETEQ